MSHLYKSIELVGTSDKNWADAVQNAYNEAKKTIRGIRNIEILKSDVKVKEDIDKLVYRVRIRLNFEIEK